MINFVALCSILVAGLFGACTTPTENAAVTVAAASVRDDPTAQAKPQTQPESKPQSQSDAEIAPAEAEDNQLEFVDPDIIPVDDPELDALLDKLEHTADDLRNFTARIVYRKTDGLLNRKETRTGNIIYISEPVQGLPGNQIRKFAIIFDILVVNEQRRQRNKHYIFDGRWLAEIDDRNKQFQAREIVPPGRVLDPLKLGEGPFPLPLGQKKNEVLKRFVVDWADIPPSGMLAGLENVIGIVLVPRPGSDEAGEFNRVDVYYDKKTMLPVGVDALHRNGDRKTVRLKEMAHNIELDAQTLSKVNIAPPQDDEWVVIVEPWQGN